MNLIIWFSQKSLSSHSVLHFIFIFSGLITAKRFSADQKKKQCASESERERTTAAETSAAAAASEKKWFICVH